MALTLESYFEQKALDNMRAGGKYKGSANLPKAHHIDVRQQIADLAGVGARNVSNVKTILQAAHPRLIEALRDGALTMASAADLALAYVAQGKFAESQPLAREAMEVNRKNRPDGWQGFRAESLLGASFAGEKKYAEAEPLLLEGYQGMLARKDRIAAPDRYHLELAHQWLVQLYKDWGKPQKAAQMAKELEP